MQIRNSCNHGDALRQFNLRRCSQHWRNEILEVWSKTRERRWLYSVLFDSEHLRAMHRKDLFVDGLEALWLQVKFPSSSVLFSVMYRPPNDRKFFDFIMSPPERTWLKTSNIILLGDFNCDLKQGYNYASVWNQYLLPNVILLLLNCFISLMHLISKKCPGTKRNNIVEYSDWSYWHCEKGPG